MQTDVHICSFHIFGFLKGLLNELCLFVFCGSCLNDLVVVVWCLYFTYKNSVLIQLDTS